MKKRFFLSRLKVIVLSGFLLSAVLFSSCKKTVDTPIRTPVAGLMAFNLAPDKSSIGITLSGNNFTNEPLLYTNYTGGYQGVYTGTSDVSSYDYSSGALLASASQLFEDSSYYSVFVLGANGKYRNVVVKDSLASLPPSTGEAFIRYVNAIPDSTKQPLITISSNGTGVFNNTAAFGAVSNFKAITPGDVSVQVNAESNINASRTITLEKGKIYTVLLAGIPQETDSTKAVQIRFIQNGVVSNP